jgi:hypothetical protein
MRKRRSGGTIAGFEIASSLYRLWKHPGLETPRPGATGPRNGRAAGRRVWGRDVFPSPQLGRRTVQFDCHRARDDCRYDRDLLQPAGPARAVTNKKGARCTAGRLCWSDRNSAVQPKCRFFFSAFWISIKQVFPDPNILRILLPSFNLTCPVPFLLLSG